MGVSIRPNSSGGDAFTLSRRGAWPRHRVSRAVQSMVEILEGRVLFTSTPVTSYTITDLGSIGGPTAASEGRSINATGQAAVTSDGTTGGASAQHAARFSGGILTDLGTLGGGTSQAYGINDSGTVVGAAQTSAASNRAFVATGNTATSLGTLPGGDYSEARAINTSGQVAGFSQVTAQVGPEHAFIATGSTLTDLHTLSHNDTDTSRAFALNDVGHAAGESTTTGGDIHAFFWNGSALTDVGTLGGLSSTGLGINEADQVVGRSYISTSGQAQHAFLWTPSRTVGGQATLVDLGALSGDAYAVADDINNNGVIVGGSASSATATSGRAWIIDGGAMTNLNALLSGGAGWNLNEAYSVNDSGQIAGVGTLNGIRHAFILSPGSSNGGDTNAPQAHVNAGSDISVAGGTTHTVTVAYTDNDAIDAATLDVNDITVTRSAGGLPITLTASSVSVNAPGNGAARTATYTLAAPGGAWNSPDNGTYTVALNANAVADATGNFAASDSDMFAVNIAAALVNPTAAIAPLSSVTAAGATSFNVVVTYNDPDGEVDASTFGVSDVTVTGAAGALGATGVSVSPASGNAATMVGTYTFAPPGGAWDSADNGAYAVSVGESAVTDATHLGSAAVATSFEVNVPADRPTEDPTFNNGNAVSLTGFVGEALATVASGRIYVAGHQASTTANQSQAVVRRLNADGSLDRTFGTGGQVVSAAGANEAAYAIALDEKGRVVTAGIRDGDFVVTRYKPNGAHDRSFGGTGSVVQNLGGADDTAYTLALQPDGSIIAAGRSAGAFAFVRLFVNGNLDTTFGGSRAAGRLRLDTGGPNAVVGTIALAPDGSIIAAGASGGNVAIVKLLPDGSPDASFNGGNVLPLTALLVRTDLDRPDNTVGLALQADGKFVVASRAIGSEAGFAGDFGVARIDPAGSLDASFGTAGVTTIPFGGDDDADEVQVLASGEIYVLGTTNAGGAAAEAVVALTATGQLNTNFDGTGKYTSPAVGIAPAALHIGDLVLRAFGGVQIDGKLLVGIRDAAADTVSTPLRRLNVPGRGTVGSFGVINGKSRKLTFKESDGTVVTLSLKGGGVAQAFYDGSTIDLVVSGSTPGSVLLASGKGGPDHGVLALDNVRTDAPLKALTARTANVTGTIFIDGSLGAVDVGRLSGTLAASGSISSLNVRGDVVGAQALAGADLGSGSTLGGSGAAADAYNAAVFGKITIRGAVTDAVFGAGVDPVNGDFRDTDNRVIGGAASVIKLITVKGAVSGTSRFFAGAFGRINAPGKIDPGSDPRFQML